MDGVIGRRTGGGGGGGGWSCVAGVCAEFQSEPGADAVMTKTPLVPAAPRLFAYTE